jgi:ATP-dependent Lon protease
MNIPAPLLDRMEVIRLSGYTEDEKVNIAQRYLVPKQIKNNGLGERRAFLRRGRVARHRALLHARGGVRSLEREIAKICRKVVKRCC